MCCRRPYCVVGVPADAITVLGYYSTISCILAFAALPSAVDICDLPISLLLLLNVLLLLLMTSMMMLLSLLLL